MRNASLWKCLPAAVLFTVCGQIGRAELIPLVTIEVPNGFFDVYEYNRKEGIPNYITEDFLARAYAMVLEDAVTQFEEGEALPALRELTPLLRGKLGSETEAERVAQGFLAVFDALLTGREGMPAEAPAGAAEELAAVLAAGGVARSPLMRQTLDYSQFGVRGKYTRSEELARYFRAARYAGTVLFPLRESRATGVSAEDADALTGAALLLSRAVVEDARAAALYAKASEPLGWLFGVADAMTVEQYARRAAQAGSDFAADGAALRRLRQSLFAAGVRPRVLGGFVDTAGLEPGLSAADALAGWQFLPARLTPESAAFQELVHDRVGPYRGQGEPFTLGAAGGQAVKAFPTMLELGALLGSDAARQFLEEGGDTAYEGYEQAFARAAEAMKIPSGLATEHFALLRAWLGAAEDGWDADRRLNTALGFWTLQRHGAAAYAKQSYTVATKSLPPPAPERLTAWIEPAEDFYRGLARTAREAGRRVDSDRLAQYADIAERCADVAREAASRRPLDAEQAAFLNGLDRRLKLLTGRSDGPIAIDFHTDANSGLVVQAALGRPRVVAANLPGTGGGRGRGALFAVHQFKQPLAKRLTDEAWVEKLGNVVYRTLTIRSPWFEFEKVGFAYEASLRLLPDVRVAPAEAQVAEDSVVDIDALGRARTQSLRPKTGDRSAFDCTLPNGKSASRVIGSRDVEHKQYPWQVDVYSGGNLCGGSLIGASWVLTAAVCVDGSSRRPGVQTIAASDVRVVHGATDLRRAQAASNRRVANIYVHPGYDGNATHGNDIALLRLSKPIRKAKSYAKLPSESDAAKFVVPGACAVITGHGVTKYAGDVSPVLQAVNLSIVAQQDCRAAYSDAAISEGAICSGLIGRGSEICQGSSGSLLAVEGPKGRYVPAGVVSWGEGCALPGKYDVNTRISHYLDWIRQTMRGGSKPMSQQDGTR